MNNEKVYHELIPERIYMCGAKDVDTVIGQEGVEVIVDLRAEKEMDAWNSTTAERIHAPLRDNTTETEEELMAKAIQAVIKAYEVGKKVAFHCGAGKGRTGAVAIGTLLELGLSTSVEDAEQRAKEARAILSINDAQRQTLHRLYP
ncbi:protein-tyrosine phosphatase family protein [Paenibacillus taiwanensis]|uniref:protein-tyrosine phosphatase family protein n=1 Tax=Paenibacillus taiwanensis TaxID=401638 RepID=UPI00040381C7|nr:dual specificity protein phosphatase family protein [Paenibacillus taiwanensis]